MTRQVTLKEWLMEDLLADLNRRARERGEDIEIVLERPKPRLVSAEVVQLQQAPKGQGELKHG
jgi:hypothetical protein